MHICIKLIFIFKFYGIEVIQLYSLNLELNQVFHFMKKKMCLPDLSIDQN